MARICITISEEIKKYFEDLSKKTGVSQSALIALELNKAMENNKKKE